MDTPKQIKFFENNMNLLDKELPLTTQSERNLLAAFMTISDYRSLLFDPSVNLSNDFTNDYITGVLLNDFNQVIRNLRDYAGVARKGIQEALDYTEGALKELYAATFAENDANKRVEALIACRAKLDAAYRSLEYLNEKLKKGEDSKNLPQSIEQKPVQKALSKAKSKIESPVNKSPAPKTSTTGDNQPPDSPGTSTAAPTPPRPAQPARLTHLIQYGKTRIDLYFGGKPATLVPWEIEVDALVLPVGTLGSLSGKMADSFLEALGQQSQNFRALLNTERSARKPTQAQPQLSRYIEPETPLLLDTEGKYPNIKPRYIIAATAYRRAASQAQNKSQQQTTQDEDESQDALEVGNAGDAAEAVIRLAAEKQISRLAIPLLGTGAAGLDSIEVVREMLAAIRAAAIDTSIQQVILLTRDWGAYSHLVGLVQHKPQKSHNDLSEGDDRLKVKAEMDALADTLLLTETGTPLAVGILGGWGSGKSFAMRMLHERMAEIRAMAASDDYVGHPYLIDFDAWTYAKSNLWSSLMQTIFLELNRQLEREKKLGTGRDASPLESVRAIYPGMKAQTGTIKFGSEVLWEQLRDNRSQEREELEKQEKELAKKRAELEEEHTKAAEEVDKSIQKEIDDAIWQPLLEALSKPFGKSWTDQFNIILGREFDSKAREPQAFRTWLEFCAFGLFAVIAFLVPAIFQQFKGFQYPGILLAIGASITGMMRTFDRWKTEVDETRANIRKSRDTRLKEKLNANKEIFNNIEQEIKTLEIKVSDARRLAGVTATFGSLLELCQARLRQADYENELGLMHRVKLDLDEMDWALKEAQKILKENQSPFFTRGKPRIVLFIDDLDRCPPGRVVEVLEATQLLLKTELFVVVLAMDVRYVTRALEKAYEGILAREGDPSGLDYIEKIIQIPYQVRPVDSKVVDDFISSMMTVQMDIPQGTGTTAAASDANVQKKDSLPSDSKKLEEEPTPIKPDKPRKVRTLSTLSQVVAFSKDEYDFLILCCQQVNLTPRAIKRLVNVYKLLKILWSREPQWPQPEPPVEQAIVLLLTLSCSYPDAMREVFDHLEKEIRMSAMGITPSKILSDFFGADLAGTSKLSIQEWQKLQGDLQSLWADPDNKKVSELKNLPLLKLREVLSLVHSFSFVSDLGI